ncbi:nucleoside/nucleotide kinase family protein [Litorivita pollutaquae]|nr:AAA family ATPase [Litorivita pollutaquae]
MKMGGDFHIDVLASKIMNSPKAGPRRLVALAGPPASGKSTLAKALCENLNASDHRTQVVSMDGFHLDNSVLERHGLLPRKGAPETFDLDWFTELVSGLAAGKTLYYPMFDRDRDISIASAGLIDERTETILIEGNYLAYDVAGWRDLLPHWDLSMFLDVPEPQLRNRLLARWKSYGLDDAEAEARAEMSDFPNAARVRKHRLPTTMMI